MVRPSQLYIALGIDHRGVPQPLLQHRDRDAPAWREADEIAAQGPGPGAPYPGDPRASGGAALKWCLKGLPALFQ